MNSSDIYIASFDPGRKNFAFCVEKCSKSQLEVIENLPLSQRYHDDGTPTNELADILDQIYVNGEIVLHQNVNILSNPSDKAGIKVEQDVFHNLTVELNKHIEIWDKCSYFLIETQMSFGKKLNLPAVKIAQHICSYFVIKYGLSRQIIDFPSYHKTQILGAPKDEGRPYKSGKKRYKAMDKPQRKKWAVDQAIHILELRDETEILNNLQNKKKKDDMSDCLLMCQAGKYLYFVK